MLIALSTESIKHFNPCPLSLQALNSNVFVTGVLREGATGILQHRLRCDIFGSLLNLLNDPKSTVFCAVRACQKIAQLAPLETPIKVVRKPHGQTFPNNVFQRNSCEMNDSLTTCLGAKGLSSKKE